MSDTTTNEEGGTPVLSEVTEEAVSHVIPEAGPVVMDDSAFDGEEKERVDAFNDEPMWNGAVLQPFAVSRESFFDEHRVAVGAPALSKILGAGSYAVVADAIRILYLCSHEPRDWRHLRSEPVILQEAMEEWADKNIKEGQELEAVKVAMRIYNGGSVNQAESLPASHNDDETLGN